MHRSGTSLVARLTNLLGVNLGQEPDIVQAAADNPRGFWEHPQFKSLNDELLARLGVSWDTVDTLPTGWQDDPSLDDLRQQARDAIAIFATDARWGWKDPRTCVTLPFWQPLTPPMRYVICLRSVLDVAKSLAHRNGMPINRGARLWVHYTAAALQWTSQAPRLCVFYEDVLDNPQEQAARLNRFISGGKPLEPATLARLREAIDLELNHHRSSLIDVIREAALPDAAKSFFVMLRSNKGDALAAAGNGFNDTLAALREVVREPGPAAIVDDLRIANERLDRALDDRRRELDDRNRELDDRNRELADRIHELAARTHELEARDREIAERVGEIAELAARCDGYEQRLGALGDELRALSSTYQASLATNQELETQLRTIFTARAWHWLSEYRRVRRWINRRPHRDQRTGRP